MSYIYIKYLFISQLIAIPTTGENRRRTFCSASAFAADAEASAAALLRCRALCCRWRSCETIDSGKKEVDSVNRIINIK